MIKLAKITTSLIVLFLFLTCSSIPETHFYLIDYPITDIKENPNPIFDIVIGVTKFKAGPLYADGRLVYRENPYEGKYYHYHRWIAEPGKLVTDKTIEQLNAAKLFKQVVVFPRYTQCDYILNGNIKALEEWDETNKWFAKVKIAFELVDKKSNKLIWKKIIEKQNPVTKKSPFAVVTGINQSVKQCVEELQKELSRFISESK